MSNRDPLNIAGQTIAEKYLVERAVGEGGFAVVYRAMHTIWNKPVAIKFFSELSSISIDQRDEMQQAFINEGALLTELSSQTAAIVQARDVGTYTTPEGRWMPFMVLEWLEGRSLEEVLADENAAGRSRWSLQEVLRILGPVAAALDVAHGRGIAHRDIKPPNIFVLGEDPRAPNVAVKILDFGVAKMITDNTQMKAALAKTGSNITSFTPQYGAPEQFSRSYGATGPWTDVFALALVAVEMLVGRAALEGDDLVQLAFSSGNPENRPTPRRLGATVPDAVEAVFAKALSVAPIARFARAGEMWEALEAAAKGSAESGFALSETLAMPPSGVGVPTPAHVSAATVPATTHSAASLVSLTPQPVKKSKTAAIALALVALVALAAIAAFVVRSSGEGASAASQVASSTPAALSAGPPVPSASAAAETKCPEKMVRIPAGQFYMGSDLEDAPENQRPTHNVTLGAFCFDEFEVTASDYKRCSDRGACRRLRPEVRYEGMKPVEEKAFEPLCNVDATTRGDHPMNCVSWADADTYCRKNGKRLPTEAEWEYATRGPDGRVFPWGDDKPTAEHLNACDADCAKWAKGAGVLVLVLFEDSSDGYAATAPVGKFPKGRSRFGPWDVVGNVWEWVADWEGPYSASEKQSPTGPATGEKRVMRGGGWNGARESWLRPSHRYAAEPERSHPAIGFRCAADL